MYNQLLDENKQLKSTVLKLGNDLKSFKQQITNLEKHIIELEKQLELKLSKKGLLSKKHMDIVLHY